MNKTLFLIGIMALLSVVFSAPWPGDAGVDIHQNLPAGYEPSGVVWHPYYNSLFLVSDGGTLSRMNLDGSGVTNWAVPGDLEGVTITDSASEYVYLAVEYPFAIVKFNPLTGQTVRSVSLTGVVPATVNTNSGIEGLTFVPNGAHPYANSANGGLFYVGVQENGVVYAVDVDFNAGTARLVGSFTPVAGRTDIAGLDYNAQTKVLYVDYDSANFLREITTNNSFIQEYVLPGLDQEGVAVISACPNTQATVVVAEDTGRVMKYQNYTVTCPVVYVDADSDGFNSNVDCNDNNAQVNPGRAEVLYNGVDDDCNANTPDTVDADHDNFNSNVDCNDNNALVNPGMSEVLYDGIDNDCNASTKDTLDADNDSYNSNVDCNDANASINPGMSEILYNGVNDDCNANTPDTVDADSDGFNSNVDCNDNNAQVNPGHVEVLNNGIDDDCNANTPDVQAVQRTTLEAENMPTLSGSNVRRLADSVAFYTNGYAQGDQNLSAGVYNITVYARADTIAGRNANLRVTIDGTVVGNYPITSSTFVPVTLQRNLAAGSHRIRVQFTNDYYRTNPTRDVNLYVDKVTFER